MHFQPVSKLVLPPGPWRTLLGFLVERFPAISESVWSDRLERGMVQVDGDTVGVDAPYPAGKVLTYRREVTAEPRIPFEETIVHADEHIVVADKPHFLPVMPAGRHVEETLSVRLARRLGNPDLVALHRLDSGTAGLVVFSVRPDSRDAYTRLFRERRITKVYEALAPPLPELAFPLQRASRIERGEPFFRMREVDGEANAFTRIDVMERGAEAWRYRLEPVSGRKHQLRVHMAGLGAAIAGDPYYPILCDVIDGFGNPLRLLARELRFIDPLDGEERVFRSERTLQPVNHFAST